MAWRRACFIEPEGLYCHVTLSRYLIISYSSETQFPIDHHQACLSSGRDSCVTHTWIMYLCSHFCPCLPNGGWSPDLQPCDRSGLITCCISYLSPFFLVLLLRIELLSEFLRELLSLWNYAPSQCPWLVLLLRA